MFETLLEKILLSHFGRFLQGLDRSNIHFGVWSGNLMIENVSLRREVLDFFEFPIELKFSHIEKFQVIVPWSKLSQQSVEILIQNVFVIISQKPKKDWKLSQINNFSTKWDILDKLSKKIQEDFLQARAKIDAGESQPNSTNMISVDKQGILDRLIMKVLDNLVISVQNIHIRYENDLEKPGFCWGITLAELKSETTDNSFVTRAFIDRTDLKNKVQQIFKKTVLKKLGLYWNSNELNFFHILDQEELRKKMLKFSIYELSKEKKGKRADFIISLFCELKATINPNYNYNIPEYQLKLNLQALQLHIRNSQMQDLVKMLDFFSHYQRSLHIQTRNTRQNMAKPDLKPLQGMFKKGFINQRRPAVAEEMHKTIRNLWTFAVNQIILQNLRIKYLETLAKILKISAKNPKNPLSILFLEKIEKKNFKKTVEKVAISELKKWMKDYLIDQESKKLEEKDQKRLFTLFKRTKTAKGGLSKEERAHLAKFLSNPPKDLQEKPSEYVYFCFDLELESISLILSKKLKKFDEGLLFKMKDLKLSIRQKSKGFEFDSKILDFSIELYHKFDLKNEIKVPILYKSHQTFSKSYFLNMEYEKNPSPETEFKLILEVGALEVRYFAAIMSKFISYFMIQSEDGVRNIVIDTLQSLEANKIPIEEILKNSLNADIFIKIAAPTLIIPLSNYNDPSSPCWIFKMGDMELKSEHQSILFQILPKNRLVIPEFSMDSIGKFDTLLDNNFSKKFIENQTYTGINSKIPRRKVDESEFYDVFSLKLSSIELKYYSSIEYFTFQQRFGALEELNAFNSKSHEYFTVIEKLEISMKIQMLKTLLQHLKKPKFKLFLNLANFELKLTSLRLLDLKQTASLFGNESHSQEFLQTEINLLLENAYKQGFLKKRGKTFANWSLYYGVFSGGFLYFFFSKNDQSFESYISLRDAKIKETSYIGKPNSFSIKNGTQEVFLSCGNRKEMRDWIKILTKKIKEFSMQGVYLSLNRMSKSDPELPINESSTLSLTLHMIMESGQIKFLDNKLSEWLCLSIENFCLKAQCESISQQIEISIQRIRAFEIDNRDLFFINGGNKGLIITVFMTNIKENCNIEFDLTRFNCNWQPVVISKLMEFILIEEEKNKEDILNIKKFKYERRRAIKEDDVIIEEIQEENIPETEIAIHIKEIAIDFILISGKSLSSLKIIGFEGQLFIDNPIKFNGELKNIILLDLCSKQILKLIDREKGLKENKVKIAWKGGEISSKLDVQIENLSIFWWQQPIMRAIDFIVEGILSVLTKDYSITEIQKNDTKMLLKAIKKPKFSELSITLKQTKLILQGPGCLDRIIISIDNIGISNFEEKNTDRLLNFENKLLSWIWCENYVIKIDRITTFFQKDYDKDEKIYLSQSIYLFVLIQMTTLEEELGLLYGDLSDIDRTNKIKLEFQPFQLKLLKEHYEVLMDICINNIAFDDGLDSSLKYSFSENNKSKNLDISIECEKIEIVFQDNFPEIHKYFNVSRFPFCELAFLELKLTYFKDSKKSLIKIFSQQLQGNSYDYVDDLHESFKVTKNGFIDEIHCETMSLQDFLKLKKIKTYVARDSTTWSKDSFLNNCTNRIFIEEKCKFCLEVLMKSEPLSPKTITINLLQMKFLLNLSFVENLRNFTNIRDSQPNPGKPSALIFYLNIQNLLLCVQGPSDHQILAAQTKFSLTLSRNMDKLHRNYHKTQEKNNFFPERDKKSVRMRTFLQFPLESSQLIEIKAPNLELFNCNKESLFSQSAVIKKRTFLKPTNFSGQITNFFCYCGSFPRKITFSELFLGKTQANISFKDILLLYETGLFQVEEMKKARKFENFHEDELSSHSDSESSNSSRSIESEKPANDIQSNSELPTEYTRSLLIEKIEVLLIDDVGETLIPVLQVILKVERCIFEKLLYENFTKEMMKSKFGISLAFYNPNVGKLEPVIELTRFGICVIDNQNANPKKYITIELEEEETRKFIDFESDSDKEEQIQKGLNVNISHEMVKIFMKTYLSWEKEANFFKQEVQNSLKEIWHNAPLKSAMRRKTRKQTITMTYRPDFMKFVSIYNITNRTGYDLYVKEQDNNNYTKALNLPNGKTLNFEIDSEEIDLDRNFYNTKKIEVNFKDFSGEKQNIIDVELNRLRRKRCFWQGKKQQSYFICEIDVNESIKSLVLSSPIMLKNNLSQKIKIILKSLQNTINIEILPLESKAIPIEFNENGSIAILLSDFEQYNFYKLSSLCSLKQTEYLSLDHNNLYFIFHKEESNILWKINFKIDSWFLFINNLPCQINLAIFTKSSFNEKKPIFHEINSNKEHHCLDFNKEENVYIQLKIDGYKPSKPLLINSEEFCDYIKLNKADDVKNQSFSSETTISEIIFDETNSICINIVKIEENQGYKKFYFYIKGCIINQTGFNLSFYSFNSSLKQKNKLIKISEIDPVLLNEQNFLAIGFNESIEISNELSIEELGTKSIEIKRKKGQHYELYELGLNIEYRQTVISLFIPTKFIEIQPKYVLINNSLLDLEITQINSLYETFKITSDERQIFYWTDCTKEKSIIIRILTPLPFEYSWSGPIDIQFSRTVDFMIPGISKEPLFYKLDIQKIKSTFFLTFTQQNSESYSYILRNDCNHIMIHYRQYIKKGKNPEFVLLKGINKPFAWSFPDLKQELEIYFKHTEELLKNEEKIILDLNTVLQKQKIKLLTMVGTEVIIQISMTIKGATRIIHFQELNSFTSFIDNCPRLSASIAVFKKTFNEWNLLEKETQNEDKIKDKDAIQLIFYLNLREIGISLITKEKNKRKEFMYIKIIGLENVIMEENEMKTIQIRIKYLNFDNNTDYGTPIPVVLTPTSRKKFLRDSKQYLMDICVKYNQFSKQILCINSIKAELNSLTIRLDDQFLESLFIWIDLIQNSLKVNENKKEEKKLMEQEWKNIKIPEINKYFYIKEFMLSTILLQISFSRRVNISKTDSFFLLNNITSALGKAITNIDDVPIILPEFKMMRILSTIDQMKEKLIDHYKNSLVSTILKVIGSINIIGNPLGLYNYIKSGFIDLIEKPKEGMVQGPLQAGLGLFIGAGSLLKQTFAGTCNSIHHISGSFATGLTLMSFDETFIENRRKFNLKQPKNMLEGIDQGLNSIYKGLEEGITGIFKKPYDGFKEDGISGFFIGSFTGISGLIIKPVTGLCDATSKTAEGLKNTAIIFDDKPNIQRLRWIRPFYDFENYIKSFDYKDAEILYLLQTFKNGKFSKNILVDALYIENISEKDSFLLVVMIEETFMISKNKQKIEWRIKSKDLLGVELGMSINNRTEMRIFLKKIHKKKKKNVISFEVPSTKKFTKYLYGKITSLIDDQN